MRFLFVLFILVFEFVFTQNIDSKSTYYEDQLYLSVSYNSFINKYTNTTLETDFSYGFSLGYIRDIPLHIEGKWALGVGLGYSYDSFNHNLNISSTSNPVFVDESTSHKFRLHNIEVPFQIRWRNSDITTYKFWRVYTGFRLGYNFQSSFNKISSTEIFNRFNGGIELSAGYSSLNFYVYYGLTSFLKDFNPESTISPSVLKLGLIFYLL